MREREVYGLQLQPMQAQTRQKNEGENNRGENGVLKSQHLSITLEQCASCDSLSKVSYQDVS